MQFQYNLDCPTMQSMVTDLLEKEKAALLSDLSVPGLSEGVTELIMEGVSLDHEQLHIELLKNRTALYDDTAEWLLQTELHGQGTCTRVHAFVTCFQLDKLDMMHQYNFVQRWLITLGMSSEDINLQELTAADVVAKNAVKSCGLGNTMKANSWLWGAVKPEMIMEAEEEEWITENVDCWTKEAEILEEKQWRVEVSYRRTTDIWICIANSSNIQTGEAAYAYKVADVYQKLANHCIQEWEKGLEKIAKNQEEDHKQREEEEEQAWEEEAELHPGQQPELNGGAEHSDEGSSSTNDDDNTANAANDRKQKHTSSSESSASKLHSRQGWGRGQGQCK
ncbi:hypothetical protein IW262DRAFT_1290017 [Armillaria fumosa]|nr:hypothetical protein IW262DRAFT_1290017 [Armillaria fumosa]